MITLDLYCVAPGGMPGTFLQTVTISGPLAIGAMTTDAGTTPFCLCDPALGFIAVADCVCDGLKILSGPLPTIPESPVIAVENNICPVETGCFAIVTDCGVDSHIEYSTDGGQTVSSTLPVWADGLRVVARCVSDADPNCFSPESNVVIAAMIRCCPTENCHGITITRK